jgi:hypothetical protein
VIRFGIAGLSAAVAGLDYVLLPLLCLFVGMTLFAFLKLRRK